MTVLLWATAAYADDEAVILAGKAVVTAKLIDPDSARFTGVHVITRGRQFVCGRVGVRLAKADTKRRSPLYSYPIKNIRSTAIIYGGRSITDDRFSNLAQPAVLNDICGS